MKTCKWCNATVIFGPGPKTRTDWERWRCKSCSAFGYTKDPSPNELAEVYDAAWREVEDTGAFAKGSTDNKIAHSLLEAIDFPDDNNRNPRCLDYGGGTGHLATALHQKGANVTVYEPYGKNPGLPASINWLSNTDCISPKKFDWIFMVEVIEHLLDPLQELHNIYHYLSPKGRLVITTPNAKGWRATLDKFNWREVQNPTHINLFSKIILIRELKKAGFTNIKRIHRPVVYREKGIRAIALSITQIFGIDGGLRIIAKKC
jgi:2-polyprenyl-3-methyl-5-hydroxy-6-metoxy-1,4-benzoquinol methylase